VEKREERQERPFPLMAETERIVRCAVGVLNSLGHGYLEKVYENSLCVEFGEQGIPVEQQRQYQVHYKSKHVGTYVPDLIAFGSIIVEVKTIDRIGPSEVGQVLNYLKLTKSPVGIVLNFKHPRLEWRRLVWDVRR
jgi:GxxExxY protein